MRNEKLQQMANERALLRKVEELTASVTVAYGDITGTLSDQTDLQAALDTKQPCLLGR